MSIKSDAEIIRNETVANANTATRVGGNLLEIANDLIAKQVEIDATNVTLSGALMDSEVVNLAQVKAFDTTDYLASSTTTITTTQASDITANKAKFSDTGVPAILSDGTDVSLNTGIFGYKVRLLIGLSTTANQTDSTDKNFITDAQQTVLNNTSGTNSGDDLNVYQLLSEKDSVSGYAGLDASGKINSSQLPAVAITETFVVASETAMLAIVGQKGDVAVRTDISKSFILTTDDPTILANWQDLISPTSPVSSVFGRVGVVTAQGNDYTFSQIDKTTSSLLDITTRNFSDLQNKPTTISGYSITDAYNKTETDGKYLLNTTDTLTGNLTVIGIVNISNRINLNDSLNNTFVGEQAGISNTTGNNNVASGYESLLNNTTGNNNVASGYESLLNNISGNNNVASGSYSMGNNTTGDSNIASGYETLKNNIDGSSNIASGYKSLVSNISGSGNIASGYQSLLKNTTGDHNISLGAQSLSENTTGDDNIAYGRNAGRDTSVGINQTCLNSIFIGKETKANADGETNQIVIGDTAIGNGSNTVTLGNSSITDTYLKGKVSASDYRVSALNTAPSSATDAGITGEIRYTSDYIYLCVATNTWKRTAISTWT